MAATASLRRRIRLEEQMTGAGRGLEEKTSEGGSGFRHRWSLEEDERSRRKETTTRLSININ